MCALSGPLNRTTSMILVCSAFPVVPTVLPKVDIKEQLRYVLSSVTKVPTDERVCQQGFR